MSHIHVFINQSFAPLLCPSHSYFLSDFHWCFEELVINWFIYCMLPCLVNYLCRWKKDTVLALKDLWRDKKISAIIIHRALKNRSYWPP